MKLRNKLGQNFLINNNVAKKLVDCALITDTDSVYEIGTGQGILTEYLCKKAKSVISSEIDFSLYKLSATKLSKYNNLQLKHMDGLQYTDDFDIFISSLPYSESERFIYWLLNKNFKHAVVILQKEFIDKITSLPNTNNYRSISVISQYCLNIISIETLSPSNFYPPPKVQSILAIIKPNNSLSVFEIQTIKKLFSFRRKKLSSVLKNLTKSDNILITCGSEFDLSKRIHEFPPNTIVSLAQIMISNGLEQ